MMGHSDTTVILVLCTYVIHFRLAAIPHRYIALSREVADSRATRVVVASFEWTWMLGGIPAFLHRGSGYGGEVAR